MGAAIVARCDAPPIFEPSKGVFYSVTLFIERLVVGMLDFAVLFRWNARIDPFFDRGFAKPIAVIASIAGQRFGFRQGVEHKPCPFTIAHLPFAQQQDQWLTLTVRHCVKL